MQAHLYALAQTLAAGAGVDLGVPPLDPAPTQDTSGTTDGVYAAAADALRDHEAAVEDAGGSPREDTNGAATEGVYGESEVPAAVTPKPRGASARHTTQLLQSPSVESVVREVRANTVHVPGERACCCAHALPPDCTVVACMSTAMHNTRVMMNNVQAKLRASLELLHRRNLALAAAVNAVKQREVTASQKEAALAQREAALEVMVSRVCLEGNHVLARFVEICTWLERTVVSIPSCHLYPRVTIGLFVPLILVRLFSLHAGRPD